MDSLSLAISFNSLLSIGSDKTKFDIIFDFKMRTVFCIKLLKMSVTSSLLIILTIIGNPHRAHEYLQKSSLEHVDGLFIHPKIGKKKPGDYTNNAIIGGYESLIQNYYPTNLVVLSTFKSRMMYAGPREAVFDSIVRKNHGCTHFIIGRDHAGVGNYYADFEAQQLFDVIGNVGIKPLYYHYAFYCTKCDGIVSEKICPHDSDHHIEPSGTELRRTLSNRELPPSELMRPEVAKTVLSIDKAFIEE